MTKEERRVGGEGTQVQGKLRDGPRFYHTIAKGQVRYRGTFVLGVRVVEKPQKAIGLRVKRLKVKLRIVDSL